MIIKGIVHLVTIYARRVHQADIILKQMVVFALAGMMTV